MSEEIRNAIKKIVGEKSPTLEVGEVQSVDWDKRICTVKMPNGLEFEGVRLRAVADDKKEGLCIKPKKNSMVTVAMVDGREAQLEVIGYTEIEAIELVMQDVEFKIADGKVSIKAKEVSFNDGNNKGIPILDKIKQNFDAIKKYLDIEKQAISTGIKEVGAAMSASGVAGASAFDGAMASNTIQFEDMENTKVKH